MKNFVKLAILAMFILSFAACSSNGPSTSQVEKDVTAELKKISTVGNPPKTIFEVVKLAKTNGKKETDEKYLVEVSYTLKYQMSFKDVAEVLVTSAKGNGGFDSFANMVAVPVAMGVMKASLGEFKKGDSQEYQRWIAYGKTEKGWKLEKFNVEPTM